MAWNSIWNAELNWCFYPDGLVRLVVTYHSSYPGITSWVFPIWITFAVQRYSASDMIYELYDSDLDGDAEIIWQQQLTGISNVHHPNLGPPNDMNGKFWIKDTQTLHSVIVEATPPY